MKRLVLTMIAILTMTFPLYSQYVYIPDSNFLNALIKKGIDTNGDSLISYAEAEAVRSLDVRHRFIRDLSGIESFIHLEVLLCEYNYLSSLDVSDCPNLVSLRCFKNRIDSLDVSQNTSLESLICQDNGIRSLDLSQNTRLRILSCSYCHLSSLDLSQNTDLESLNCGSNQLTILDVSGCPNLRYLQCGANQLNSLDLSQNTVLDSIICASNQLVDLKLSDCPDLLYLYCDNNQLSSLDVSACIKLDELSCGYNQLSNLDVSMNTRLRLLNCSSNQLSSLDVSACKELDQLDCESNQLRNLDVSLIPGLGSLKCSSNQLINLDVSGNTGLRFLNCSSNQLSSLDVSACKELDQLVCESNQLSNLDVSLIPGLGSLKCSSNQLSNLDVSGNTGLRFLDCSLNQLISLDVSKTVHLKDLVCSNNELKDLDVSNCQDLQWLSCGNNKLTSLDPSNNSDLQDLFCGGNQLEVLDVSECQLLSLGCSNNRLTKLDVSNQDLITLYCDFNNITHLYIGGTPGDLSCGNNPLTSLDLSSFPNGYGYDYDFIISLKNMPFLEEVCVWKMPFPTPRTVLDTTGSPNIRFTEKCVDCIIPIPDTAFLYALIDEGVDTNEDSLISYAEAEAIRSLRIPEKGISNMKGIGAFVNLDTLDCQGNSITKLYISGIASLKWLSCDGNQLVSIDLSNNRDLDVLSVSDMPTLHKVCVWTIPFPPSTVSVNATGSPKVYFTTECLYNNDSLVFIPDTAFLYALIEEGVDTNEDSLISYAEAELIKELNVEERGISDLTGIKAFANMTFLNCGSNSLSDLKVSHNALLSILKCANNQLSSLDLSNNLSLDYLVCGNNRLTKLDLSNNRALGTLFINDMPTLNIVCVWTVPFPTFRIYADTTGSPNIYYTTDCNEDIEAPILSIAFDTLYQQDFQAATSSEDGMIYLVHSDTLENLSIIRETCIDSVIAVAESAVMVPVSGLGNAIYWLYAIDSTGNISEPVSFNLVGVNTEIKATYPFKLYPNPISNHLTIQTRYPGEYSMEIISANGVIISSVNVTGSPYQIDFTSFKEGVYIISIKSRDFIKMEKVIKL